MKIQRKLLNEMNENDNKEKSCISWKQQVSKCLVFRCWHRDSDVLLEMKY